MYKNLSKTEESSMFNNWWKYRQEFYEPETEEEFQAQIVAGEAFMRIYKGTPLETLAQKLVLLHEEDTEIRLKERGRKMIPKEEPVYVSDEQMADINKSIPVPVPVPASTPNPIKREGDKHND